MDHNYHADLDEVSLRPLNKDDIEQVRCWRNDKDNSRFLRDIGYITSDSQMRWYESYLKDNDNITFSIVDNETVKGIVGTVSIYNFKGNDAEVGKILIGESRAHGRQIGRKAMAMAMMIGFSYLNVRTFHAFVEVNNVSAFKTYMNIGFKIEEEHLTEKKQVEYRIIIDEESLARAGYTREMMSLNER